MRICVLRLEIWACRSVVCFRFSLLRYASPLQCVRERRGDGRAIGVELPLAELSDHPRETLVVVAGFQRAGVHLLLQLFQFLDESLDRNSRHGTPPQWVTVPEHTAEVALARRA